MDVDGMNKLKQEKRKKRANREEKCKKRNGTDP